MLHDVLKALRTLGLCVEHLRNQVTSVEETQGACNCLGCDDPALLGRIEIWQSNI